MKQPKRFFLFYVTALVTLTLLLFYLRFNHNYRFAELYFLLVPPIFYAAYRHPRWVYLSSSAVLTTFALIMIYVIGANLFDGSLTTILVISMVLSLCSWIHRNEQLKRKLQLELEHIREGLEQRVVERTADLRLANEKLADEIEQRIQRDKEQHSFSELLTKLTGPLTPRYISALVMQTSRELFRHDAFALSLFDEDLRTLIACYTEDTPPGACAPVEMPFVPPEGQELSIVTKLRLVNRKEAAGEMLKAPFGDVNRRSMSLMYAPIQWNNRIIGDITAQSYTQNRYSNEDLERLRQLAEICSGALARCQAEENQRRLEEELRQSQKLRALGQLAGGVAHDFKNLLTALMGQIYLLKDELPEEKQAPLRNAVAASKRASDLIEQLLAFSRKSVLNKVWVDPGKVLDSLVPLLRETIDRRIDLSAEKEDHLPLIFADRAQIETVLMNLCINARDAIKSVMRREADGEKRDHAIRMKVFFHQFNNKTIPAAQKDTVNMRYTVFQVSDNGSGMDDETKKRIFEPFFTTKEKGEGTGLGLASSLGIIQQHDGWITVDSQPGNGTTFSVYIPAGEFAKIEAKKSGEPAVQRAYAKESETVLIIDDEEMIRMVLNSVLKKFHYQVLLAENGAEGLTVFEREKSRIHLVVLDLSMPQVSGFDVIKQIKSTAPDTKIIVCSGYHEMGGEEQKIIETASAVISKPFVPEDLILLVRRVLDS